jgi:hypothetical protein
MVITTASSYSDGYVHARLYLDFWKKGNELFRYLETRHGNVSEISIANVQYNSGIPCYTQRHSKHLLRVIH